VPKESKPPPPPEPQQFTLEITFKAGGSIRVPFTVEGKATPWQFAIFLFQAIGFTRIAAAAMLDWSGFLMMRYVPETGWYFDPPRA
jgi:hypothetical protein